MQSPFRSHTEYSSSSSRSHIPRAVCPYHPYGKSPIACMQLTRRVVGVVGVFVCVAVFVVVAAVYCAPVRMLCGVVCVCVCLAWAICWPELSSRRMRFWLGYLARMHTTVDVGVAFAYCRFTSMSSGCVYVHSLLLLLLLLLRRLLHRTQNRKQRNFMMLFTRSRTQHTAQAQAAHARTRNDMAYGDTTAVLPTRRIPHMSRRSSEMHRVAATYIAKFCFQNTRTLWNLKDKDDEKHLCTEPTACSAPGTN